MEMFLFFSSGPVNGLKLIDRYYCFIFTRGQFWPSGIVVACVCLCVRLSVCAVITCLHHPFKLGSPNLDHRCIRPWLRPLLFWGVIDLDLQGQI